MLLLLLVSRLPATRRLEQPWCAGRDRGHRAGQLIGGNAQDEGEEPSRKAGATDALPSRVQMAVAGYGARLYLDRFIGGAGTRLVAGTGRDLVMPAERDLFR